jgi:hypothetical protein
MFGITLGVLFVHSFSNPQKLTTSTLTLSLTATAMLALEASWASVAEQIFWQLFPNTKSRRCCSKHPTVFPSEWPDGQTQH